MNIITLINEVDYAILGIIVISLLIGALRGFIKEAISLLAWITGIWLGVVYNRQLAVAFEDIIDIPTVRMGIAFVLLLVITLMFASLIGYILGLLIEKTGLIVVDRFAGMVLGIGRGLLVVAVLVMLIELTPIRDQSLWQQSSFIPFFQTLAIWMKEQLPPEVTALSS